MSQITVITECFVQRKFTIPDSKKLHYLSPLGLGFLSFGNSQYGLLFTTTSSSSSSSSSSIFEKLKKAVSEALVYFYPLSGRLVTKKYHEEHSSSIFVDCTKGAGARLIHASAIDITIDDIHGIHKDVPKVVQSFFDLGERQVNLDGHTRALLSIQLTQLHDGLFIGCCINHCVADAITLSHFLNILSQIFVGGHISHRLPTFELPSSLSNGYPSIKIPYLEADEFVTRLNEGSLRDRIFQFSSESMRSLKSKANVEANNRYNSYVTLSSFKALCVYMWMSITRARKLQYSEKTTLGVPTSCISRLNPALGPEFFGCHTHLTTLTVNVGELLRNGLGWATKLIHEKIEEIDDEAARAKLDSRSGIQIMHPDFELFGDNIVIVGGSPRLDLCGVEFGLGKPLSVHTGYTNRWDGKIVAFPGRLGSGSVDLQVTLDPETMSQLLLDQQFINYVPFST